MTTPDILQAYPLGTLEVETPDGRGPVIGLRLNRISKRFIADVDCFNDGIGNGYSLADVTPRLFSFADLCTPLPDGTVPYDEIGKMGEKGWHYTHPSYKGCRYDDGYIIERWLGSSGTEYDKGSMLRSHIWGEDMKPRVSDYLRRNHFACEVNGKPLVEGTDYIRKEARRA